MASTSDLRPGLVIMHNGELCTVLESIHRTPGNLRAFYQVKLRKMRDGKLLEHRFRSGEEIETIRVDRKEMQYLYREGDNMVFMDTETYDQVPIPVDIIGNAAGLLKESGDASISFVENDVVQVELPPHVNLVVTETEPGVRGDTASSATKPAILESGATILVPLFINEGDQVRVDTRTNSYLDRVKN
ncbi:MAG: elongation factor P [Ignavibacteriae bacterium]|nr:elongation factor P [Ignavibacteriota bacterium]MCB9216348.1 elongation factor P [Ignavibacteria bacterium]